MGSKAEMPAVLKERADVVGSCSADVLNREAPVGHRPHDYLDEARTVITFGCGLSGTALKGLPGTRAEYMVDFEAVNRLMVELARCTVRELEAGGYATLYFPVAGTPEDRSRLKADISHRHAAAACGLGSFGVNNLLLVPGFGAGLRLGTIVTTAAFGGEESAQAAEPLCDECGRCVEACPSGALKEAQTNWSPHQGGGINKAKCYHYMFEVLKGKRCGLCVGVCPHT